MVISCSKCRKTKNNIDPKRKNLYNVEHQKGYKKKMEVQKVAGKILVTARSFGREPKNFNYFTDRGYQLIENPYYHRILREEELCELLADADGCLIGLEEMTEAVYRAAPKLVVAQKMGIGVDNMAVEAATRHGVAVTNVPSATVGSVADLTFGLLLCISKKIVYTNRRVMQGMWPMDFSNDMCGKTLGIIGFGRIGQAVARRAKGFGMRILAFDFFPDRQMAAQLCVELRAPGSVRLCNAPRTENRTDDGHDRPSTAGADEAGFLPGQRVAGRRGRRRCFV